MTKEKSKLEVWKTNNFLNSGYKFSLVQLRIIHYIYGTIQDYVYAVANGKGVSDLQLTLYEDAYLYIPVNSLDKGDKSHSNIYNAFRGLKDLDISQRGKSVESFILSAHRKDNKWRVLLPRTAVKFFIEKAEKGVTALESMLYMSAESSYTISFYEQMKQRVNLVKWYTTPDELCDVIQAPESARKNFAHLRMYIIERAQKELKELFDLGRCAIWFEYKVKRAGRGGRVTEIIFTIHTRKEKLSPVQIRTQTAEDMKYIAFTLKKMMLGDNASKHQKKANEEFINKALSKLQDSGNLGNYAKRLEKLIQREEAKGNNPDEKGALARYILEEDFGII